MDLVSVHFLRRNLFGCHVLLIPDCCPLRLYGCLPFRILLLGVQNSGVVYALLEIGGHYKSFAGFVCHFLVKTNLGGIFLSIRFSTSDVTWKPFFSTCVMINIFACRPGIRAVFVTII